VVRGRQVRLKLGEQVIIDEGKTGWGNTLALTNKRLLILERDNIIGETPLENVSNAYAETHFLTNLTQLKIKLKDGKEMSVIFRRSSNGLLYGDPEHADLDIINLTNKYVEAINRAIGGQMPAKEA
jgi:hypothetical protein